MKAKILQYLKTEKIYASIILLVTAIYFFNWLGTLEQTANFKEIMLMGFFITLGVFVLIDKEEAK